MVVRRLALRASEHCGHHTTAVPNMDNITYVLGLSFGKPGMLSLKPRLQLSYTKLYIYILTLLNMEIVLIMLTVMCVLSAVVME